MDTLYIVIFAVLTALLAAIAVFLERQGKIRKLEKDISAKELEINNLTNMLDSETKKLHAECSVEIATLKAQLESERASHEKIEAEIRESAAKALDQVKKTHEEALSKQVEALKSEMKAETEELLRKREAELTRKAKETYSSITGGLEKDIRNMKEAFEENKKTQTETSAQMSEKFANAVRNIEESAKTIGNKADNLADAMRGNNKMQGGWGEEFLERLFEIEGFEEGLNYDRESTLRDRLGKTLKNDDSGKMMRPDFIIHFPDNNDIVIDAKVSIDAYKAYIEAKDETVRKIAAANNLKAITDQVNALSGKNYQDYLLPGHKFLDFVIMFVPNYGALQLAYAEDQGLWKRAFDKNVLITSQETLLPFLRMITIAWTNAKQVRNQEEIIKSASLMVKRVGELVGSFSLIKKHLDNAQAAYAACDLKLRDSGHSIVKSAQDVVQLGVPDKTKNKLLSNTGVIFGNDEAAAGLIAVAENETGGEAGA